MGDAVTREFTISGRPSRSEFEALLFFLSGRKQNLSIFQSDLSGGSCRRRRVGIRFRRRGLSYSEVSWVPVAIERVLLVETTTLG